MRTLIFILIAAAVAAGCTVGPVYQKPKVSLEKNFAELSGNANTNPPPADWWKTFHDPELEKLINEAGRENYDLQIATLRVREARYQRNIMAGNLLPTVDANAGYLRAYGSKNVNLPIGGGDPPDPPGMDANDDAFENELSVLGKGGLPGVWSDLYQMGFDATWEIDVFGGIRRRVEAANEQMQAAVESRRNMAITLSAEVARDYMELRGTQERLDIARKNLSDQKIILQVTKSMRTNGLASDLEVTQAAAEVATTSATVPPLEATSRRLIHALSILLAREPTALASELEMVKPLPVTPPEIPVGLPSQLLERRPDIREAERQIAAATANIGVAEADLFPKFALTGGSAGIDSSQPGSLFSLNSRYFLISPTITWRIFDAGRIANNIKLQKAGKEEAVLQYRSTILTALQEVEDALVMTATDQARRADLIEALNQSRQSLALSRQQYEHGLSNFLNVLDAERAVFSAEDNLTQSDESISTDMVALYKSLGGGW
ncbi:MAG TPA: efflux transporter outer membrane subunit [Pseudomonadales bacterium]|nr:efflux transporter outer membrane subunit [Pseudomonadales bacterium]